MTHFASIYLASRSRSSNLCLLRSKAIFMDVPETNSENWLVFFYLYPFSRVWLEKQEPWFLLNYTIFQLIILFQKY